MRRVTAYLPGLLAAGLATAVFLWPRLASRRGLALAAVAAARTLCHTGLVWKAPLGERTLHFELAGILNQNFISGGWEAEIAGYPTVGETDPDVPLEPRHLVVGIAAGGAARAYRWPDLDPARPVADRVGGTPILLVLHPDGFSPRRFDRRLDGRTLDLFLQPSSDPHVLLDAATGNAWDFSGRATSGPLCGRQLGRIACLEDYWFDWSRYHPGTKIYAAGRRRDTDSALRRSS